MFKKKLNKLIFTRRAAPKATKELHHGCMGNPTNYNNYINGLSSPFSQTLRTNQPFVKS
jgi:hypothetical protein